MGTVNDIFKSLSSNKSESNKKTSYEYKGRKINYDPKEDRYNVDGKSRFLTSKKAEDYIDQAEKLKYEAYHVFNDVIEKTLTTHYKKIDSDSDITVIWDEEAMTSDSDAVKAEYSIDIEANNIILSVMGWARHSNDNYYCMMKAYRTTRRSRYNKYIGSINTAAKEADKFVSSLVAEINKAFEKAESEEE